MPVKMRVSPPCETVVKILLSNVPFRHPLKFCQLIPVLAALMPGGALPAEAVEARQRMVAEIAAVARDVAPYTGRHALDARVMDAVGRVPRHAFVPAAQRKHAYENRPLSIGSGQTISQ